MLPSSEHTKNRGSSSCKTTRCHSPEDCTLNSYCDLSHTIFFQQCITQVTDTFCFICREFGLLSSKALQQAIREEDEICERLNLLLDILVAHRELCERHEKGVAQDHNKALAKMLSLKKRQMQGVIRGSDVRVVVCTSADVVNIWY